MSSSSGNNNSSSYRGRPIDPLTRTALRYTISPREYELLHQYLITRAPRRLQKRTVSPATFEKKYARPPHPSDAGVEDHTAAMRAALRCFVVVYAAFKSWELMTKRLAARRGGVDKGVQIRGPRFGNVRIALSLSSILFFHKVLHRFFRRLRVVLLQDDAKSFRTRNPKVARLLTSHLTPALGAALSGAFLGVSPSDQLRMTCAIYIFTRSLEFSFNALEDNGFLWNGNGREGRPWWFGSWMLMPLTCGQLLHTFVFDRDCFPESYGRFILNNSPGYIQKRPRDYPRSKPWPGTFDIVDALAELSRLRWPPFISPILFPKATISSSASPSRLAKVAPITNPAHPGIVHASCAVLHPQDPSCARTLLKFFAASFPRIARFFTLIYGGFALLAYKTLLKAPLPFLNRLSARILRVALFLTGAIGSSWASICFFNNYLPRTTLPTQRWFLGGFLGGMWSFVARHRERGNFLYSARLSLDSLYQVGKKRGWWRGIRNGDVLLFVASLALLDVVYEAYPGAVKGPMLRKALGTLRGEGFTDRARPFEAKEDGLIDEEADEETSAEKREKGV